MSSLDSINKMYYIVDGCGNYYRINAKDQLVVAGSRDEAGVFSFFEANQRIGGGKKTHFYSTIPVEESEEKEEVTPTADISEAAQIMPKMKEVFDSDEGQDDIAIYDAENKMSLPYDIKSMDWNEYLTHFCYIASGIHNYQDELNQVLSDIDMQICDIMHYIELYNLDGEDSIRMMKLLKECREQRRDIKDEMIRTECFQKSIGTSGNIAKAKESIKQIKKLDTRIYHPRKLQELFENCPEKTVRCSKLRRSFQNNTCMDIEREYHAESDAIYETEEDAVMEYTKQQTVFDGKENNWRQFAMQQAEFYANAEQYIYNLQDDLNETEIQIEQILNEIEDSNYNAVQGYKVVKQLKELRNFRKEKQKELECLYILTERFDCRVMADIVEDCVSEMEAVFAEPEQGQQDVEEVLAG